MLPILIVTILSADQHEELHKQLDSIEKQLSVIEKLQIELNAAKVLKDPTSGSKYGTEKKDIYLSGIDTQRTVEYNNHRKGLSSSIDEDSFIIKSRAPILHFKARTPTFASEIKVSFKKQCDCNIRQAIFTFINQSEIKYRTNVIDFDNKCGLSNVINLNTEVAFTDIEVDIPLNWGSDQTCLPDIIVKGPIHKI
ncbi:hypothetical protein TVAG_041690 [Trichomonas vaginalis G3]|uniref:Uncharacterized protein n=1 Tax=Trichomonas vaginalis (strain ATCC PRA-98 / G3) TaxID=412133 RepID=A2FEW3_TRIV3|nr:hypothetical protein TVAGG3_0702810 [Trichomonas vaginalis G3]EAX96567.1 hypothetical protein TVAG_041690 [Trichomonas vaginalis G3]KAI5509352.1 hypothetical protein TVAGG3_0702810 [Trichomonas vaginalis G3]|eukprot:XP_001309497.1 hypothetical protein [Trichomonas vaginalis G3]